jgi:hypothetical protein
VPQDLEQRYEEFARGLARAASRRDVLKLLLGVVGAAAASAVPARLLAAHKPGHHPDNNSAAAQFCNALFPEDDPRRGACKSMAARGVGPFFECEGDPARFCGDQCCGADEVCNLVTGTCELPCVPCGDECCADDAVCCVVRDPDFGVPISFTCLSCPLGQVPLADCSGCGTLCATVICPGDTTCCQNSIGTFGTCCFPGTTCCASATGAATCCPPELPVCFAPGFATCLP